MTQYRERTPIQMSECASTEEIPLIVGNTPAAIKMQPNRYGQKRRAVSHDALGKNAMWHHMVLLS